jgi:hypothetical protein
MFLIVSDLILVRSMTARYGRKRGRDDPFPSSIDNQPSSLPTQQQQPSSSWIPSFTPLRSATQNTWNWLASLVNSSVIPLDFAAVCYCADFRFCDIVVSLDSHQPSELQMKLYHGSIIIKTMMTLERLQQKPKPQPQQLSHQPHLHHQHQRQEIEGDRHRAWEK